MKLRHPAKYTNDFIPLFAEKLKGTSNVIDIFAGTGRIAEIKDHGYTGKVYCNEIEPEWAELGLSKADVVTTDDAEFLPFSDSYFDAICTSPTYGNRMADHHNAKDGSRRNTYTHTLGRTLHEENTGKMQWGRKYKEKHLGIWAEAKRVLKPNGILILNISDHIRLGEVVEVSKWHRGVLTELGFEFIEEIKKETPRLTLGANYNKRVGYEYIFVFKNSGGDAE